MIKNKIWLCCYLTTLLLSQITPAEAKTNYDALHTKHDIVAKYECGKLGYQAISRDSYGGYSYGKWQISTKRINGKPSTFDFFLNYLKDNDKNIYIKLIKAGGYQAAFKGNENFIKTWKSLAKIESFKVVYDKFLLDTQIIPVYTRMDKSGNEKLDKITTWASENNAIQAALKSTIIQHGTGGAYKIFVNVLNMSKDINKDTFIENLYTYRKIHYPKYKTRYNSECKDIIAYLHSEETNKEVVKKDKIVIAAKTGKTLSWWDKLKKLIS